MKSMQEDLNAIAEKYQDLPLSEAVDRISIEVDQYLKELWKIHPEKAHHVKVVIKQRLSVVVLEDEKPSIIMPSKPKLVVSPV